jgi:hypothetical protein
MLICIILISNNIDSQVHYIGLQTGVNISNVKSDNNFFENSENRKGISFGMNYELLFQNRISIGTDILFIPQGYIVTRGNDYQKDFYNFLNLPVKIGYNIGNRFNFFTRVGFSPSVLLNAKMTIRYYDPQSQTIEVITFNNKDAKKFDFAGIVSLGAGYELNKIGIFALADYRHSFTSFTNPMYYERLVMKHYAVNFSIGIKYRLN